MPADEGAEPRGFGGTRSHSLSVPGWTPGPGLSAPGRVSAASPGRFTHTGAGGQWLTQAGSCLGPSCSHLSPRSRFAPRSRMDSGTSWGLVAACGPRSVSGSGAALRGGHRLLPVWLLWLSTGPRHTGSGAVGPDCRTACGSSWTGAWTRVSCTGRWIPCRSATRMALAASLQGLYTDTGEAGDGARKAGARGWKVTGCCAEILGPLSRGESLKLWFPERGVPGKGDSSRKCFCSFDHSLSSSERPWLSEMLWLEPSPRPSPQHPKPLTAESAHLWSLGCCPWSPPPSTCSWAHLCHLDPGYSQTLRLESVEGGRET